MTIPILALVAVLAAEPSTQGISLAAPGFQAVNVEPKTATFASDHFAQSMTESGIRVMTSAEVTAVIGLERQKQLLGCSETGQSCMAELAGALGTDGLVTGSLGKFNNRYQVNIKVLSSKDAAPLAVTSFKADNDEQLMDSLSSAADAMAAELFKKLNRTPQNVGRVRVPRVEARPPPPANVAQQQMQAPQQTGPIDVRVVGVSYGGGPTGHGYRARGWDVGNIVSLGLGAGCIVLGGAGYLWSDSIKKSLRGEGQVPAWDGDFRAAQGWSYVAYGLPAGAVLAAAAGGLMIFGAFAGTGERVPIASLAVQPGGFALALGGSWE